MTTTFLSLVLVSCGAFPACVLTGCDPDEEPVCESGESRCSDDLVEICDPEGQWETRYDCQEYGVTCYDCPTLNECIILMMKDKTIKLLEQMKEDNKHDDS